MHLDRRRFLQYCVASAATLGLDLSVVGRLQKALAAGGTGLPTVVWLNGASCTGCTVSLANLIESTAPVDIADLLINVIELSYHTTLMGAAGDAAVEAVNGATSGPYILVVEGGIPTAFGGHACILWTENRKEVTALDAVTRLAPAAEAVLCVGTCSSFGGIPAGSTNRTQIRSVSDVTGRGTINIAGCPAHPDWIVSTVAQLLAGASVAVDPYGRPLQPFALGDTGNIHANCPRNGGAKASTFGMEGLCLEDLGCKGPKTQADCPARRWNNATNWCVGANAPCVGCTEPGFPDAFSPLVPALSYGDLDE